MIPEGWSSAKFGEITRIAEGQVDPRKAPFNQMLHIGPENVSQGTGKLSDCQTCEELELISGKYAFDEKAIVYSKIRPNLNKVCYPRFSGVCSADMYPVWPDETQITPEYLYQLMLGPVFLKRAIACSMRTGMPKINRADLNGLSIEIPPLIEQRSLAETLQTWDRAIETVEALFANARAQKLALMQQLLPQGTTPPKKRLPGFSGEWRKLHIGDVAKEVSERAGEEAGYPVLSCSKYDGMVESLSYFKKKVYSDDTSNYKVMRRGTFGFPSNHVEEGSIGYQDLCDAGIVSPIYCVFATSNEVDDGFLYKLLKTDRYRQIFAAATNASVDRRGSLRWKEFSRIPLPLPPLEEQRAISEAVDAVAATEAAYQAQLTALRQEKAALMQQLLTGKRRVKLPESEVA